MHFDLPSQNQPGDREEALARDDFAEELARHISRYPARHIDLRSRVRTLSCVSEAELNRLVPAVDYFLGLYDWQRTKGQVA
jgi:hypothetical protein